MLSDTFGYDPDIPENARDVFMWLCQEVAFLRSRWSFYLEVYGSEQNVQLLSTRAPMAFQIIEESVRNDIAMGICRVSDRKQLAGNTNLTLEQLVDLLGLSDDMVEKVAAFRELCKPVRQYRDKQVAHNDLNTMLKPLENPLPGIGKDIIELIIQTVEQLLNQIYKQYGRGEYAFKVLNAGGAEDLLFWLRKCDEYERSQQIGNWAKPG